MTDIPGHLLIPAEQLETMLGGSLGWVVVRLTASPCDSDSSTRCVMDAIGPFENHAEAKEVAGQQPAWTNPHVVTLFSHWPP